MHQAPSLLPLLLFETIMPYTYFPRDSGVKALFQLLLLNEDQLDLLLGVWPLQLCPAWWQNMTQRQEQPHTGRGVKQISMQVSSYPTSHSKPRQCCFAGADTKSEFQLLLPSQD